MCKILILAYDFPPYVSVGGLRPYSWYKYLHEYGVHPVVITRQWSNKYGNYLDYIAPGESNKTIIESTNESTLIKTPYRPNIANKLMIKYGESKFKFVRRLISGFYEISQFILPVGPKSNLYFEAKKYLSTNKVDLIIATGDPFILFGYASKLSKKYNTPWIADYRDPWSQKQYIQNNLISRIWHSFLEKKIIVSASVVTTVSEFLKDKISQLIKNKPFLILPNGYDPEAINETKNIIQGNECLNVAFVGSIYEWHPITIFLSVITKFITSYPDSKIKINFYGINKSDQLEEMIKSDFKPILNYISIHKKMANNVLLKELAKQNVMLLFNDYSILGTKIYDYIGLNRLILLCFKNDPKSLMLKSNHFPLKDDNALNNNLQEELINKTNSGIVINNSKHLEEVIQKIYSEFSKEKTVKCNTINAENYSRKHQVKELADLIKKLSSNKIT